jgi:hypothetical protein
MTNKKNKLNCRNDYAKRLFLVSSMAVLFFLFGLTRFPKPTSEKIDKYFPLFGHFYPEGATNTLSIPNLRAGSGIR